MLALKGEKEMTRSGWISVRQWRHRKKRLTPEPKPRHGFFSPIPLVFSGISSQNVLRLQVRLRSDYNGDPGLYQIFVQKVLTIVLHGQLWQGGGGPSRADAKQAKYLM